MCGIVGYTGPARRAPSSSPGSSGSSTAATTPRASPWSMTTGDLFVEKKAGKLANLPTAIADRTPHAAIGLAHTRWATHGRPNDLNAHPHQDCTGEITVIHNGIIENFRELRDGLEARGHTADLRDRHRGARPSHRGGLRRRPGRRRPGRPRPGRGRLRHRGHASRRGRPARRRPPGRARSSSASARRDVPGQRRRGDPRPHRPGRSSSRRATSPTCGRGA